MLHLLLPTTTSCSSSSMPSSKPISSSTATAAATATKSSNNPHHHHHHHHHHNHNHNSLLLCKHSPSATLDLLILILVLFSGTFLLSSYFSYLFHSLSLLLSPLLATNSSLSLPFLSYILGCTIFFATTLISIEFCCGSRSRKCEKPGCKGLKKALEFDLQMQTEDCIKNGSKEIDKLPWKGGSEGNPDYECLRAELRKMAPPNGRAVLLFRARCGCPIAKLEGWGPKRGRRHKKALTGTTAQNGDHR